MNSKKYILAKSVFKRFRKLAQARYMQFGCNDRLYKTYVKAGNFAGNVLNYNGWNDCIKVHQY